jgi:hypothetical protein
MNKPDPWLDLILASGLALAACVGYAGYLIATAPARAWGWLVRLWRME